MAFKMKGFSPFTAKKKKSDVVLRDSGAESPMQMNKAFAPHSIDPGRRAMERNERTVDRLEKDLKKKQEGEIKNKKKKKKSSAMKKEVPSIPKKPKSPSQKVSYLVAKQKAGTITPKEKRELKRLRKFMETGPGSYGNEQWDKE
jgi:deoxyribodipyrimidine photolyase|tara:strand:+ start:420 stop:851 length:432 start_codon:yes stop_codon:yes gene_type:complete